MKHCELMDFYRPVSFNHIDICLFSKSLHLKAQKEISLDEILYETRAQNFNLYTPVPSNKSFPLMH